MIGGGIGAALALLFAPKRGIELRRDIANVTRKAYNSTLEMTQDLKQRSADFLHTAKEKVENVYDLASNKLGHAAEVSEDVVSEAKGSVTDGIERVQKESAATLNQAAQAASGRKGSNIV
ncbi:MAG: YtxH domain-containing protein [Acidobacteriota bacterium]|nr:MAG: YtxH domain-containing protein [Acidobacteriota bacterium]